jgi:protein-disulfide isomerase
VQRLNIVTAAVLGASVLAGACTGHGREDAARPDAPPPTASDAAPQPPGDGDGLIAARSRGDENAPITVFEASDFQCPYCRSFWDTTLPILEREYIETGKVRFIFLNLPLTQIHPNAAAAHEFAMCAAVQDRFWPVHDLLYRYQAAWAALERPSPYFMTLADSAELNRDELQECFDNGAVRQLILEESQLSFRAGIRSTPTFVIERGLLAGAQPIEVWRPILDSLLEAKQNK